MPLSAVREEGALNCIERVSSAVGWSPWLTPRRTRLMTEKKTMPWAVAMRSVRGGGVRNGGTHDDGRELEWGGMQNGLA